MKKTRLNDVAALLLFYNYISQKECDVAYPILLKYQKIIEENLIGIETIAYTRIDDLHYQFFSFVSKEQGKWYVVMKKNNHVLEDMYSHIEEIPIEVIIASQMENALASIGLQLKNREIKSNTTEEIQLKRKKQHY